MSFSPCMESCYLSKMDEYLVAASIVLMYKAEVCAAHLFIHENMHVYTACNIKVA